MILSDLFLSTDVVVGKELSSLEISGIANDSRRVKKGNVYISLSDAEDNIKRYAKEAEKNGAAVFVGKSRIGGISIPQLVTDYPRRTFSFACANFYGNPQNSLRIVGITGTNGKTSTAYMLKTVLAHEGYKTGLIGTLKCMIGEDEYLPDIDEIAKNNFMTMTTPDPDALFLTMRDMVQNGVEILVMEVSSHSLALDKLAPIKFEIGIFTNISSEHLDFHSNMEDYLLAKAKLFTQCEKGIFNLDDENSKKLMGALRCKKIGFAVDNKADYNAVDLKFKAENGCEYTLVSKNARFKIKTSIPGRFTVYNTLAAVSAAREMGVGLINVQNSIYSLNGICGRLEKADLGFNGRDFSVFIDYAHTPYAFENLLNCVKGFKRSEQRVVTLFGCGGDRDKQKRCQMGKISVELSDFVIITSDNPRTESPSGIISDILNGVGDAENYIIIENRKEAIEYAIKNARSGDIVLLVGKGHEKYEIDKDGIHPFSEIEIAKNAVRKRA